MSRYRQLKIAPTLAVRPEPLVSTLVQLTTELPKTVKIKSTGAITLQILVEQLHNSRDIEHGSGSNVASACVWHVCFDPGFDLSPNISAS